MIRPEGNLFGRRLQHLRERRKLNRKELGELIGLSKAAVGRYERGENQPGLETAMKVAGFFGVSMDYISGYDDLQNVYKW